MSVSGPIQTRIETAIRGIRKTRKADDLKHVPDKDLPNEDNAILLEANLTLLKQEHALFTASLQSLRSAIADWTDLMRKLAAKDRKDEQTIYETFVAAQKVAD